MAYIVQLKNCARKELGKLPRAVQDRLIAALRSLEENPRPPGVKKLRGRENEWRIRVGDYRIVYEIHDRILLVIVIRIRHRSKAYRDE